MTVITEVMCITGRETNLPGVCKLCCWLDTLDAEGDVNTPARYCAQEGRETWPSPWYGEYLAKPVWWQDASVAWPSAAAALQSPDVLCCVPWKLLYIWDASLLPISSNCRSKFSLNWASRCSALPDNKTVGRNWRTRVGSDNDCPAERLEVLIWPAEGRPVDVSDDESASE